MPKRRPRRIPPARVTNCEERFRFQCPERWESFVPTADENVRHCSICEKNVVYCTTAAELDRCAREGLCAAFDDGSSHMVGELEYRY